MNVTDLLRTKGKREVWTCGEDGARARIRRLERESGDEEGVPFEELRRGDIVMLHGAADGAGPIDERGRVEPHVRVDAGAMGR